MITIVSPAEAGGQRLSFANGRPMFKQSHWAPAFAGETSKSERSRR